MIYKLTFINDTDYCNLKPSDIKCQYRVTVKAKNKYDAVWSYLTDWRANTKTDNQVSANYCKPVLWTVEEVGVEQGV